MWNSQRRFKDKNNPTYNFVCVYVGIELSDKKLYIIYTTELSDFSTGLKQMRSTSVDAHCYTANIIYWKLL